MENGAHWSLGKLGKAVLTVEEKKALKTREGEGRNGERKWNGHVRGTTRRAGTVQKAKNRYKGFLVRVVINVA